MDIRGHFPHHTMYSPFYLSTVLVIMCLKFFHNHIMSLLSHIYTISTLILICMLSYSYNAIFDIVDPCFFNPCQTHHPVSLIMTYMSSLIYSIAIHVILNLLYWYHLCQFILVSSYILPACSGALFLIHSGIIAPLQMASILSSHYEPLWFPHLAPLFSTYYYQNCSSVI